MRGANGRIDRELSDHDLARALERAGASFTQLGLTLRAAEAHRAAGTLTQCAKEHQTAADEVARCRQRVASPKALSQDATALGLAHDVLQIRGAKLDSSREHAHRVLKKHS